MPKQVTWIPSKRFPSMLGKVLMLNTDDEPVSTNSRMSRKLRKIMEKTFDAKLFEVYGVTETGSISLDCEHGGMRVNMDRGYNKTPW